MNRSASSFSRPVSTLRSPKNVNLVDCSSLLEAGDSMASAEPSNRVQIDYPKLFETLQTKRTHNQWASADVSIALVSANEESESQQRFTTMLTRSGFETDVSSYRDNYVSVPAGRRPSDFYNQEKGQRPLVSLSSRIAYALGVLARWPDAQIIVVSHAFELYWPMHNFLQRNPSAKIGLAYFPGLMDHRWRQVRPDTKIQFLDLEERDLFGGIDSYRRSGLPSMSGLSRL
jgi:hypothetical protein